MDEFNSEVQDTPVNDAVTEVEQVAADAAAPTDEAVSETEELVESTEDASTEEVDATEDETETEVTDSFDDLLDEIPSNEALLKAHTRIPQATKDALVKGYEEWRNTKAELDKVGGSDGVQILAPVFEALTKPSLTVDEQTDVLRPLLQANPYAMSDVLMLGAVEALFTDDPNLKYFSDKGDVVLQTRFGEGYDAKKIEKLVALVEGGYVDPDADYQLLTSQGADSEFYEQQRATITQQNERIKELEKLVKNPHLIEQPKQNTAVKELESEVTNQVMEAIKPFRERARWSEDSPLTTLVIESIMTKLKDSPDYQAAVDLVSNQGSLRNGDKLPLPIAARLATLVKQARGKFGTLAQTINKERRGRDETSVNAVVKEQVKETTPKAEVLAPQDRYTYVPSTMQAELDKIYSRTDAAKAGR
jgi:hypothetical protein